MNFDHVMKRRWAIVLMVMCTLLWSMAGIVTRQLESARGFEVTFWRSLFAALFVAGYLGLVRRNLWVSLRQSSWGGLLSGAMWAVMFTCFMLALTRTTVANTLIVMSIAPLLTALLAAIFLHQRIPLGSWLAISLAMLGMVWMFADAFEAHESRHWVGMMIGLGVPVAAAINVITLKKIGHSLDLIPAVLIGGVLSALATLAFAWPIQASWHDLGWLAFLGCFQLGLPCMLMVMAARHLSAPEVSLLSLLEVLLGPLWVWWGAGEQPGQATLWGGSIVLAALLFNEWIGVRRQQALK
jgi:drug/metabolite transporter (DMT)-like permease